MKGKRQHTCVGLILCICWLFGIALYAQNNAKGDSERDEAEDTTLGLFSDGAPWKFRLAEAFNEELPNVLLIGDSILNGYGSHVIHGLKDKANVDRWTTGMHLNSKDLHGGLKQVVAFRKYDVIHFNIGLHGWPEGRIPRGQYPTLMKAYVAILKQHAPGAKLIWCSTTQVHEEGRTGEESELHKSINPIIVRRNKMAAEIMANEKIMINDLYGLMSDKLPFVRGDRFHWRGEAYEIMSKQIVAIISGTLTAR